MPALQLRPALIAVLQRRMEAAGAQRCEGPAASARGGSLISVTKGVPFITLKPFHDSLINSPLSNCGALVGCGVTSACY